MRARRRLRLALIATVIAAPLLAGGWIWFRDSSFVAVKTVRISGVHGTDARQIDAALTSAARRMSTLDVDPGVLRAAVASYPIVSDVRVSGAFPHALRIEVVEQPPVAVIDLDGAKTAVAASGEVLGPSHVSASLPTLSSTAQLSPGEHVHSGSLLATLRVLGAAPPALGSAVESAYSGAKGLTLLLRGGVHAYFGDATRPHAKWAALARVLADSSAAGAVYVDVRLPERPAAGFPAGVTPPSGSGEAEPQSSAATASSSESSAALAEGLAAAVGGSGSTTNPAEASAAGEAEAEPSSGEEAATHADPSEASGASEPVGG